MDRKVPWRRLAFALAVPVAAVGAIALTAGVANSSTGGAPAVAQTEQPNQQPVQPVQPTGNPNPPQSPQIPRTLQTRPATTTKPMTTAPVTTKPVTPNTSSPSKPAPGSVRPSVSLSRGPNGVLTPVPVPGAGNAGTCGTTMSPPVTVQLGSVGGKQALVNQAGCAIYMNNQDTASSSACDATCLQVFNVVPGPAKPGTGADQAKLNTFNRTDGTVQATYGGHQLYTFAGDAPGQANAQGVQQTWFLLDANGNPITS
jgi:predicted lipoprotein with Yx(FWY)xxD motif